MKLKHLINLKWLVITIIISYIFFINFNHNKQNIYGSPATNTKNKKFFDKMTKCISKNEINNDNHDDIYLPNHDHSISNHKLIYKYYKQYENETIKKKSTMYSYNKERQLIQKMDLLKDENYEYTYNFQNQIIFKTSSKDKKFLKTYEYNGKNQLIITRDSNNKIQSKYEYNKKGQLVRKIKFLLHDRPSFYKSVYTYKYNNLGQRIQKIYDEIIRPYPKLKFINKRKKINKIIYTYKYNNLGQRIKKTWSKDWVISINET